MALDPDVLKLIPRPAGKINLNAGTLSPTPLPVQARAEELRRMMATDPSDFCWRRTPELVQTARTALAAYLNVPADELLLLPNVTFAVNLVVSSLSLLRGTEVLVTDHEYGSMLYAWQRWADVRDWNMRSLALPFPAESPEELIRVFDQALTPSTRVLFLYHCTSPTGLVLPLKEICAMARERDVLTVVDGAHAPGSLPCNLKDIGADFYASNTHKWLMGPASGGFLHVARHRRMDLRPLVTSWGWPFNRSEAFDDSGNGGSRWQWDLEFHGTTDRVAQMTIADALAFRTRVGGEEAILRHMRELGVYTRKTVPLPCSSPEHPDLLGPLIVFEVPPCDPTVLRDRMYNEFDIECPVTQAAGKHYLRVSTGVFNTPADIDRLAAAVRNILGLKRGKNVNDTQAH